MATRSMTQMCFRNRASTPVLPESNPGARRPNPISQWFQVLGALFPGSRLPNWQAWWPGAFRLPGSGPGKWSGFLRFARSRLARFGARGGRIGRIRGGAQAFARSLAVALLFEPAVDGAG